MEMCGCPDCGAPALVEEEDSYDVRPGDTVRVRCIARHWFWGRVSGSYRISGGAP